MKTCPRCRLTYANPAEHFHKTGRYKDGYRAQCKKCAATHQRAYIKRPDVRPRRAAMCKAWYEANLLEQRARRRAYMRVRYHQRKRAAVRWAVTLYRLGKVDAP